MFDIGAIELLVVVVVAIIVIGPKDMPQALRVAGRWVGKIRRASAQFRSGFDAMVREAEMEDMERKWKEQNARIMAESPGDAGENAASGESAEMQPLAASAEAAQSNSTEAKSPEAEPPRAEKPEGVPTTPSKADKKVPDPEASGSSDEPMLPLGKPGKGG